MVREILAFLLEDEEETLKDILDPSELGWGMQPGDVLYLYDQHGNRIRRSRNLAGIRRYVAQWPVKQVEIKIIERPRGDTEGGIRIDFINGHYWVGRFACFHVLKWALRNWRNLYGAKLIVNDQDAGLISYRNPILQEAKDPAFDPATYKDLYAPEDYSMEEIKAAEPEFFSRENNRFFGTKKIYKYGRFLVLKNRRKSRGHFGNINYYTEYAIYEFIKTHDRPEGLLLHRGGTGDLQYAKEMIKSRDFRSRLEKARDEKEGKPKPMREADEENYKELYTGHEALREVSIFRIIKLSTGQYFLQSTLENVHPRSVQISEADADYMIHLSDNEFRNAAIMDFGCGVFEGPEGTE